jgi:DNA-binding transcriptional MerR regulator
MNKNIFVQDELLVKADITEGVLKQWEKLGLFKPVGYTDDHIPFYSDRTMGRVAQIQKLIDLGYGLEEIQKIVKKVGLPGIRGGMKNNNHDASDYLTVGDLAEKADVSPRTLKHWEDKGIIEPQMRSEGGFRLYSRAYIELCQWIKDLQLFGYSLEEIKAISDQVRDFLVLQNDLEAAPAEEAATKLDAMIAGIQVLNGKMRLLREGIDRWDTLLKKKKKEVLGLKERLQKRSKRKPRRRK